MRIMRAYVGLENYPDSAARERAAVEAIARAAGGCTVTHGEGAWIDDKGRMVTEPCAVFMIGMNGADVRDAALVSLFDVFAQERAIAVEENGNLEIVERPALVAA